MEQLLKKLPNGYFGLISNAIVPTNNKAEIDKILKAHSVTKPFILYEGPDEPIAELKSARLPYILIRDGNIINPFNMSFICEDKYDNESWVFYQAASKVICLTDKNKFYSAIKALRANTQVVVLKTTLSTFLFTKYVHFYTKSEPIFYQLQKTPDPDPTHVQYLRSLIEEKQTMLRMLLEDDSDSKETKDEKESKESDSFKELDGLKESGTQRPPSPPMLPEYDGDEQNITMEFKRDETEERVTDVSITLLTHYFNHSDSRRQLEFDTALGMNLANEFVKEVVLFMTDKSTTISEDIPKEKLKIVNHNKWPTYKEMIEYANENCKGVTGLIHLDCYLDNKGQWETLYTELDNKKVMYALSCHETDMTKIWKSQEQSNTLYAYKQDAWIFLSPLSLTPPDIQFGLRNAAAAFAHQLIINADYTFYNLCNRYRIMHLDNVIKVGDKRKRATVEGEYYAVPDFEGINSVPVDFLVQKLDIPDEEVYKIKCELLSKFMKLKK